MAKSVLLQVMSGKLNFAGLCINEHYKPTQTLTLDSYNYSFIDLAAEQAGSNGKLSDLYP
jgi:hypothetical protein